MREETKAAIRLEVKRWFLRQVRAMVWRADEWIHKREISLRSPGDPDNCQLGVERSPAETPTVTRLSVSRDFDPFPQIALLADDIGAETDSQQSAGQRQLRANAGCAAKPARSPAGPSWAEIKQENARRRDSHRRPLWMVR